MTAPMSISPLPMNPDLQLDPIKVQSILDELGHENLLTGTALEQVKAELEAGSPLYAALSLYGEEEAIWRYFARSRAMPFYPTHRHLDIFMTDMMPFTDVLNQGVLPHRPKIPFSEAVTYQIDIDEQPPRQIDGSRARYGLVTPSVFRHLYHLGFPEPLTGKLTLAQARALVTCTRTGDWPTGTPEQEAEIMAMSHGYEYADLRRFPVDPEAAKLVSLPIKARTRTYPHHIAGTHLAVLMSEPEDQNVLQVLRTHTQMQIQPIIATKKVIIELIEAEQREKL